MTPPQQNGYLMLDDLRRHLRTDPDENYFSNWCHAVHEFSRKKKSCLIDVAVDAANLSLSISNDPARLNDPPQPTNGSIAMKSRLIAFVSIFLLTGLAASPRAEEPSKKKLPNQYAEVGQPSTRLWSYWWSAELSAATILSLSLDISSEERLSPGRMG